MIKYNMKLIKRVSVQRIKALVSYNSKVKIKQKICIYMIVA